MAIQQTAGVSTKPDLPWITRAGDLNLSIILNIQELLKYGNISIWHLPFTAGLAVFDEIIEVRNGTKSDFQPFLKWPNDILIYSENKYKKICGIICDNYKNHFIIGIGVNLVSHPDVKNHFEATDLLCESGIKVDYLEFAEKVKISFYNNVKQIQNYGFNGLKERWKKYAYMLGKTLILRDGGEVVFQDINDDGFILATDKNGEPKIISKSDEVIGGKWE